MSEAREQLKTALEHTARGTEQVKTLTAAVVEADKMLQDAERELEIFADLETKITRWRANEIKKGGSVRNLPEDLKAMVEKKRLALEELERAQSTRGALVDELEEAKARLHPIHAKSTHCAVRVLREEMVDKAARELTKLNMRRAELTQLVEGFQFMKFSVNGREQTPEISKDMSAAAVEFVPERETFLDTRNGMAERWKSRLDLLLSNPDAVLTEPKEVRLLDYASTGQLRPEV